MPSSEASRNWCSRSGDEDVPPGIRVAALGRVSKVPMSAAMLVVRG